MRILLADDQELVRDAIAAFLRQDPEIAVETVADLPAALQLAQAGGFDLVLLDYVMPGMNRLEGLKALRDATRAPVALLTGVAPGVVADQALAAGAVGFLPKTMSSRSLLTAVRAMVAGQVYLPPGLERDRASPGPRPLTGREVDVLKHILQGLSNKEIARSLGLQEVTVKLHVKTLYRKIGARNRTHAAMLAQDRALLLGIGPILRPC